MRNTVKKQLVMYAKTRDIMEQNYVLAMVRIAADFQGFRAANATPLGLSVTKVTSVNGGVLQNTGQAALTTSGCFKASI